jgi:hypothetical protein
MPSSRYLVSFGFLIGTTLSTTSFAVLTNDKDDTTEAQGLNQQKIMQHFHTLSNGTVNHMIDTSSQFLYDVRNQHLYNPTVVNTASQLQDASGIFVEGLMREYGLWPKGSSPHQRTPLECYQEAADKNLHFAYERLYFVYKNGELDQAKNEDKASRYASLYLRIAQQPIQGTQFVPIRLQDLLGTQKIIEGFSKTTGSQLAIGDKAPTKPLTPRVKPSAPKSSDVGRKYSLPPKLLEEMKRKNLNFEGSSSDSEEAKEGKKQNKCKTQ